MPIQLKVDVVTDYDIRSILTYFNTHKSSSADASLEVLPSGYGFFLRPIGVTLLRNASFDDMVRQVRWKYNTFATYFNHHAFSEQEEQLLYRALQNTFGDDKVIFHRSICSIVKYSSPNTIASFMA
jgi:hypothetical protein